ncbi:unnamed protein product [Dicrocoelium dendriticum]|nr:unnamed protein product [Dicrocoelium dendriticum]
MIGCCLTSPGVAALDVHVDKVPTCLLPTTSSILALDDSSSLLEETEVHDPCGRARFEEWFHALIVERTTVQPPPCVRLIPKYSVHVFACEGVGRLR